MIVLAVGDETQAKIRFDVATVDTTPNGGALYDVVFMGHSLQRKPRGEVVAEIREQCKHLREGGELWITVPSLEWAARMVATREEPDFGVYYSIYGLDNEPHHCGFTLFWLRIAVETAGLRVSKAIAEPYTLGINNQQIQALQNVVVALKCTDPPDAIPELAV